MKRLKLLLCCMIMAMSAVLLTMPVLADDSPELPQLQTPVNVRWDGPVAKCDSVPNATQYEFFFYAGNSTSVSYSARESVPYFDTTEYYMPSVKQYRFKVVASADGYSSSTSELSAAQAGSFTLLKISGTWNNGRFIFEPVPGATDYSFGVDTGGGWLSEEEVESGIIDVNRHAAAYGKAPGTYLFRLYAITGSRQLSIPLTEKYTTEFYFNGLLRSELTCDQMENRTLQYGIPLSSVKFISTECTKAQRSTTYCEVMGVRWFEEDGTTPYAKSTVDPGRYYVAEITMETTMYFNRNAVFTLPKGMEQLDFTFTEGTNTGSGKPVHTCTLRVGVTSSKPLSGAVFLPDAVSYGTAFAPEFSGEIAAVYAEHPSAFNYQWQHTVNVGSWWWDCGELVAHNAYYDSTGRTNIGDQFHVIVTVDGYSGEFVSNPCLIEKLNNATPSAPQIANLTANGFTISDPVSSQEYCVVPAGNEPIWDARLAGTSSRYIGTGSDSSGCTIGSLPTGEYVLYTRNPETDDYKASEPVSVGVYLSSETYPTDYAVEVVTAGTGGKYGYDAEGVLHLYIKKGSTAKLYLTPRYSGTHFDMTEDVSRYIDSVLCPGAYADVTYRANTAAETIELNIEGKNDSGTGYAAVKPHNARTGSYIAAKIYVHVFENLSDVTPIVSLLQKEVTMYVGDTFRIPINVLPSGTGAEITYSVLSYDSCVSVSGTGVITALAPTPPDNSARIRVHCNGNTIGTFRVTVLPACSLSLSKAGVLTANVRDADRYSVIHASYDTDGRFLGMEAVTLSLTRGENVIALPGELHTGDKFMLVNPNTFAPLCPACIKA